MKNQQSLECEHVVLRSDTERYADTLRWKAYGLYLAILCALLFSTIAIVDNKFGECIARSGLITMVLILQPVGQLRGSWFAKWVVPVFLAGGIIVVQGYLAFGFHDYKSSVEVYPGWYVAGILFYMAITAIAWFAASRLISRDFSVFSD